ncbi:MAG: thiamine phosphate synthase [Planctomycetes bacterium]|nr:thiamine phosphate synthase [Planctomycetota bacterium]MCB9885513.1 thiamine phosphate synthase [Planctomycetota bacterium]
MPLAERHLCLLFDPAACRHDPWETLATGLAAGVDLVQWRTKGRGDEQLGRCLQLCREHHTPVIVNDDVDLAVRCGASGAHVGQDDLPAAEARRRLGSRWLGVSTHDPAQIAAAVAAGADYVGFGPCHPTTTKGYTTGKSAAEIAAAVAACPVPLFAIGGIDAGNLTALRELGVHRIAVSGAILGAEDPAAAAAALRRLL